MRQGGMKPKGHKSGNYWVRANSRGKRKAKQPVEQEQVFNPIDLDHDGTVTPAEIKIVVGIWIAAISFGICFFMFLIWLAVSGR